MIRWEKISPDHGNPWYCGYIEVGPDDWAVIGRVSDTRNTGVWMLRLDLPGWVSPRTFDSLAEAQDAAESILLVFGHLFQPRAEVAAKLRELQSHPDYEHAHRAADELLLSFVPEEVQEAYRKIRREFA